MARTGKSLPFYFLGIGNSCSERCKRADIVTCVCYIKMLLTVMTAYRKVTAWFLSAFSKLRKATILASCCLSVCPSAWNNSTPTGRIFVKFDIWLFFLKCVEKIRFSLTSGKNNRYFTWRPVHIVIQSRSVLLRMRNISDKLCRQNQNSHYLFNDVFAKILPCVG